MLISNSFAAEDQVVTVIVAYTLVPGHELPLDIADMCDIMGSYVPATRI
jgi:acetyl esterase/lipase